MRQSNAVKFFCASLFSLTILPCHADITIKTEVYGLSAAPQQNVNARLQSAIQDLPQPAQAEDIENFYKYSSDTVVAGLTPYGYFQPRVDKSLQQTSSQWLVKYQILPGEVTNITQIKIHIQGEGAHEPKLVNLINEPPFKVGDAFLSQPYEDYKQHLIDTAQSLGYIKANFTVHEVLVTRKLHQAQITLTLDTGPRYYFGAVHFQKNPLNDNFLERFVTFRPGKAYAADQVYQLQNDLANSNYYSNVSAVPEPNDVDHTVPIKVYLTPRAKQQYILGAGYGTDTGPRATLGSNWRYVNSYGHSFNMLLRLSQVQNTALVKYIVPGKHPLTDQYNVNASLQTNSIDQGNSQVRQLGAGYQYTRGRWQRNLDLSYQIERYSFFSAPYQTSHLLMPAIGVQCTDVDNVLFPTQGNRFSFKVQGAKQGAAADTSLLQTNIAEKWLHSFTENHMVILRANYGYASIHDIGKLPLSLSYFAGGSESIRGYGYNTLGPGRYLLTGSAEYRYRVYKKWYATTFFDIGNAFNNYPQGQHPGLKSKLGAIYNLMNRGVGVGIVWNSPVGSMQLTLAQAVTVRGRPNRVQFNMGTDL